MKSVVLADFIPAKGQTTLRNNHENPSHLKPVKSIVLKQEATSDFTFSWRFLNKYEYEATELYSLATMQNFTSSQ